MYIVNICVIFDGSQLNPYSTPEKTTNSGKLFYGVVVLYLTVLFRTYENK